MKLGERMSDELKAKISVAENCPEVKAKKSAANKRRISPNKGVPMSAEQKAKLTGLKRTPETCAKISAGRIGHKMSPETCEKIRVAEYKGGKRASRAKRRVLGFCPLNTPFVNCEGHHLDNEWVVYIPKPLHKSVGNGHNIWTGKNMDKINTLAVQWWMTQVMNTGHTLPVGG